MTTGDTNPKNPKRFDYVIIGAGPSAMGVLYGLLEKYQSGVKPNFSVAIIERGTSSIAANDTWAREPHRWFEAAYHPKSTVVRHVKSNMMGRVIELPTGQGLGGSSNINACLFVPPLLRDLESWPEQWKDSIWSSVKHLQRLMVDFCTYYNSQSEKGKDFFPFPSKSKIDMYPTVTTLTNRKEGNDFTKTKYVRRNYYDALISPLLSKYSYLQECLHWFSGTEVQRLLFEGNKCLGVECSLNDKEDDYWQVLASCEVILCAGAIESPVLLLTSGVTKKKSELNGIGCHLKDQVILGKGYLTSWRSTEDLSPSGISALGHFTSDGETFQVAVADAAVTSTLFPVVVATAARWKNLGYAADIIFYLFRVLVGWVIALPLIRYIVDHFIVMYYVALMHPISEGSISIKRANENTSTDSHCPLRRSNIDVNVNMQYLSEGRDTEAFQKAFEVAGQNIDLIELLPGFGFRFLSWFGIDWFYKYCQFFSGTYYHFTGSCAMQKDSNVNDDWVVDTELRLRSHSKIRVCDASIFPSTISNPPALTCAAIGYQLGKKLQR